MLVASLRERLREIGPEAILEVARFWGVRVNGQDGGLDLDVVVAAMAADTPVRTVFDRLTPPERDILRTMDSAAHRGWVAIGSLRRATGIPESGLADLIRSLEARAVAFTEERELPEDNPYWGSTWAGRRLPTRSTPVLAFPEETAPLFLEILGEYAGGAWYAENPSPLSRLEALPAATLRAMAAHYGVPLNGAAEPPARLAARLQPVLKDHEAVWQVIHALPPDLRAVLDALEAAGGRMSIEEVRQRFAPEYEDLHAMVQALAERGLAYDRFVRRTRVLLAPDRVLECLAQHTLPVLPRSRLQPVAAPQGEEVWHRDLHWSLLQVVRHLRLEGLSRTLTTGGLPKRTVARLSAQMRQPPAGLTQEEWIEQLLVYLASAGVIESPAHPQLRVPEAEWLRQSAFEQAQALLARWTQGHIEDRRQSRTGLAVWMDRPLLAAGRSLVLDLLRRCTPGQWIRVESLLRAAAGLRPHFLRERERLIRQHGYRGLKQMLASWFDVEGQVLLLHLTSLPFELGMIAVDRPLVPLSGAPDAAFRLTEWGAALLGTAPAPAQPDERPLVVQPNFDVVALEFVPAVLDSLGQFATPVSYDRVATYRIEQRGIHLAIASGWNAGQILDLLRTHARTPLPQNVAHSISDWAGGIRRARFVKALVVEADDPGVLEELAASKLLRGHVRGIERRAVLLIDPETDLKHIARELRADGLLLEAGEE